MTTTATSGFPAPSDGHLSEEVNRLFWVIADALEAAVDATLTGDTAVAAQIARSGTERRIALQAAQDCVRRNLDGTSESRALRTATCNLQLIAELGHITDLVGGLARDTASHRDPRRCAPLLRADVTVVGHVGADRLRMLCHVGEQPAMPAFFLRSGDELRDVADRLSHGPTVRGDAAPVGALCAALARSVLTASRYATRRSIASGQVASPVQGWLHTHR